MLVDRILRISVVSESYRKDVAESNQHLKPLIPENCKLLFECLASPDEDSASFDECFMLVAPSPWIEGRWIPVKDELMIHISSREITLGHLERSAKLENWLAIPQDTPLYPICRVLVESENKSSKEFVPDRFPQEYSYYGGSVSFLEVFPG